MDNAEATGPALIAFSRPDLSDRERELLLHAYDTGRIAAVGPDIEAFEAEVAAICGRRHAVALAGHTTALHLALALVGVRPGREVVVGSLADIAVLDALLLTGATPVVVDCERRSWGPDPDLVQHALKQRAARGRRPAAVVASDAYGQCADHDALESICTRYGVPLVVDAADSLGAWRQHRPAGARGHIAVVSFDADRIATCGGGAVLLTDCDDTARRARILTITTGADATHHLRGGVEPVDRPSRASSGDGAPATGPGSEAGGHLPTDPSRDDGGHRDIDDVADGGGHRLAHGAAEIVGRRLAHGYPEAVGHRLPNLLAAIGRAQLERLEHMIERRHAIRQRYVDWLRRLPGVEFMPFPHDSGPNCWLTVVTLAETAGAAAAHTSTEAGIHGDTGAPSTQPLASMLPGTLGGGSYLRAALLVAFSAERIQARPTRIPLHRLAHLHDAERIITGVADDIARRGLCLPSSSAMTDADVDRVIAITTRVLSGTPGGTTRSAASPLRSGASAPLSVSGTSLEVGDPSSTPDVTDTPAGSEGRVSAAATPIA